MNFEIVCRTCLRSDNLKPIFTNEDDYEAYTNIIYIATGVQVYYGDSLPQNICISCLLKINESLKFHKQCKDSEKQLFNIVDKRKNINIIKYDKISTKKNMYNVISDMMIKKFNDDIMKLESDTFLKMDDSNPNNDNIIDYDTIYESNSIDIGIKNENDNNTICGKDVHNDISLKQLLNGNNDMIEVKNNNSDINNEDLDNCYIEVYENTTEFANESIIEAEKDEILMTNAKLGISNDTKKGVKKLKNKSIFNAENSTKLIKGVQVCVISKSIIPEVPYELIKDPFTEKVSKVYCKLCSKELSIRSISSHMAKRHPGADSTKIKCDLCDSYIMAEKLNRHRVLMHGNGGIICRYCKLEFDSKENLVHHVEVCTSKKKKRKANDSGRELIECDICQKIMQKASLRMHKAMKHAGLKPVCQHCGRSFGNKFRLNEHYRAKHGYEKFKCKSCDFTSSGIMAMRNHERRHRGEKPYECDSCGAKFHAAYLLAQHRQSHRTEKLVMCDLCPASFKTNNSLHMHKLTCHSTSTYKCTLCSRSYKCRHYAVKHVRHVHKYNGPSPPLAVVNNNDVLSVTTS